MRGTRAHTREQRFWMKVDRRGPDECWEWTGKKDNNGYGKMYDGGSIDYNKQYAAHRISWEINRGPIPTGLTIDHLCRNRGCVNPDHLEPVTSAVNTMRGYGYFAKNSRRTHCPKGHPLSGSNLKMMKKDGKPYRACLVCLRFDSLNRYYRRMGREMPSHVAARYVAA